MLPRRHVHVHTRAGAGDAVPVAGGTVARRNLTKAVERCGPRTLVPILTRAAQRGIAVPGSPSGLPDSAIERCSESVRAGRSTRPTQCIIKICEERRREPPLTRTIHSVHHIRTQCHRSIEECARLPRAQHTHCKHKHKQNKTCMLPAACALARPPARLRRITPPAPAPASSHPPIPPAPCSRARCALAPAAAAAVAPADGRLPTPPAAHALCRAPWRRRRWRGW